MGSRAHAVLVLAILLSGVGLPFADARHSIGGSPALRTVYDNKCDPNDSSPSPSPFVIVHLDAATGTESEYWWTPSDDDPCPVVNQKTTRHWNSTDAPTFKPGDKFRFRIRFANLGPQAGGDCDPTGERLPGFDPVFTARISSVVLGMNGSLMRLGIKTVWQSASNPHDPDGWWTVPEVGKVFGTDIRRDSDSRIPAGTVVPAFDRASAADPVSKTLLSIEAAWSCFTPGTGEVKTYTDRNGRVHSNTHHLHVKFDNTRPIVHLDIDHSSRPGDTGVPTDAVRNIDPTTGLPDSTRPLPPQTRGFTQKDGGGRSDLFAGKNNATVGSVVKSVVTICDADFDPAVYSVIIDYRSLNRSFVATAERRTQWAPFFEKGDPNSRCPLVGGVNPGWHLTRFIEVADGTIDKMFVPYPLPGYFEYRGVTVVATDDALNARTVGAAVNVDAVRPKNVEGLTATPLPGGAVRLAWTLPWGLADHALMHDLERIDISYAPADATTGGSSFFLGNGTHVVNPPNAPADACRVKASATDKNWRHDVNGVLADKTYPRCLVLPDPVVAPAAFVLKPDGSSRRYAFTLATRDDAAANPSGLGNRARDLVTVYADVDARAPTFTYLTVPASGGAAPLGTIAVRVTDDTTAGGLSLLQSVTVSIKNDADGKWWDGSAWVTGAERVISLAASGGDVWSYAPKLKGLASGASLTLRFRALDLASNLRDESRTVFFDADAPTVSAPTYDPSVAQGSALQVTVPVADEGFGVRVVNVTLSHDGVAARHVVLCLYVAGGNAATACPAGITGTAVAVANPRAASVVATVPTAGAPLVPVGAYTLTVRVADHAWNQVTLTRSDVVVGPRAELALTAATPYLAGTRLTARATAGYDVSAPVPGRVCDGLVCAPDLVLEFRTAFGTWREAHRLLAPQGTTASGGAFTYVFDAVEVGQNPGDRVRIRAEVPAGSFAHPAAGTLPKTPASEGARFVAPLDGWAPDKWHVASTKTAPFQFRLNPAAQTATVAKVTLRPLDGGAPRALTLSPDGTGLFEFRLADLEASAALPDGEYALDVCPLETAAATECQWPIVRHLGIDTAPQTFSVTVNGRPAPFEWAARTVVLDGTLTTKFDNVSTVQQVGLRIVSAPGSTFSVASQKVEVLTTDSAATTWRVRATATVAPSVAAGARGTFTLDVTTDGGRLHSVSRTLTFDGASPLGVIGVPAEGVPTQLAGNATDTGSGIESIVFTLVREGGLVWTGSAWAAGHPGIELDAAARGCGAGGASCNWTVPLPGAIGLDDTRFNYTARLVLRDVAGNEAAPIERTLRFDRTAPAFGADVQHGGDRKARGTATVKVNVTDALSGVGVVTAVVTQPGGARITVPLSGPSPGHLRDGGWVLALSGAQLPYAGDYVVSIRAADRAANSRTLADLTIAVADDGPLRIDAVRLSPNPAEAWSGARVEVDLTERAKVAYVRGNLTRPGETPRPITFAPANVDGQTGNGTWAATILPSLNLTRGATYVVDVRAADGAHPEVSATAQLAILENDRPRVTLLLEEVGGARWVTAEPRLAWQVTDDNLDPAKIWAEIEGDGPTRNLTLTTEPAPGGLRVSAKVSPALTANALVTIRLRAADAQGATTTLAETARVDASMPNVRILPSGIHTRNGTDYATSEVRLNVTAEDAGSGIAYLERSSNGVDWTPVGGDVRLGPLADLPPGPRKVFFRAADRAGNLVVQNVTFVVDRDAPNVTAVDVARSVRFTIRDEGVGLSGALFHYTTGTTGVWRNTSLVQNLTTAKWEAKVNSSVSGRYLWYVEARDLAGNVGELGTRAAPLVAFTHNLPPSIVVATPLNGTVVRRTVGLAWLAEDPEGAPLSISVSAKGSDGRIQQVGLSAGGTSLEWDTAGVIDGTAVLRFEVSDGNLTTVVERRVEVRNAGDGAVAAALPPKVVPGAAISVAFAAPRNFTARNVTAVAQIEDSDGEWRPLSVRLPARLADGKWNVEYTPPVAGKYQIVLQVEYDGVLGMDTVTYGPFTVQNAPAEAGLSPLFLAVAAGVVLLLAGAAVAAWRWRT